MSNLAASKIPKKKERREEKSAEKVWNGHRIYAVAHFSQFLLGRLKKKKNKQSAICIILTIQRK